MCCAMCCVMCCMMRDVRCVMRDACQCVRKAVSNAAGATHPRRCERVGRLLRRCTWRDSAKVAHRAHLRRSGRYGKSRSSVWLRPLPARLQRSTSPLPQSSLLPRPRPPLDDEAERSIREAESASREDPQTSLARVVAILGQERAGALGACSATQRRPSIYICPYGAVRLRVYILLNLPAARRRP